MGMSKQPGYIAHTKDLERGCLGKEPTCNAGDPRFNPWVGKIRWRRDRLPTAVFLGFLCDSAGKKSTCNVGDLGSYS